MEAVKQDGYSLQYVKNQTDKICLEAVKQNGDALKYVKNQTYFVCLEAAKNGCDLDYIDIPLFKSNKEQWIIKRNLIAGFRKPDNKNCIFRCMQDKHLFLYFLTFIKNN